MINPLFLGRVHSLTFTPMKVKGLISSSDKVARLILIVQLHLAVSMTPIVQVSTRRSEVSTIICRMSHQSLAQATTSCVNKIAMTTIENCKLLSVVRHQSRRRSSSSTSEDKLSHAMTQLRTNMAMKCDKFADAHVDY